MNKTILMLIIAGVLGLIGVVPERVAAHNDTTTQSSAFNQLLDDYWQNELVEYPVAATYAGVDDFNDRLSSIAPADHQRRAEQTRAFQQRLQAIDDEQLSQAERVSYQVLDFVLKHDVILSQFNAYRIPILSDSGFHTSFNGAAKATPLRNLQDYENYLKRLQALPGWLQQNVSNMRLGLKDGFTQPKAILDNMRPTFAAQVTETADTHPLYQPFVNIPASIPKASAERLRQQARQVLEGQVIPKFSEVNEFFLKEYIPAARETLGAYQLPDGEAYYQALVRYFTTLDDATPDSIHQLGLQEVARIRSEMDEIIEQIEFEGSFADFLDFMRTDPQFYVDEPEDLLKEAAWLAKQIDGVMPKFFGKLPRQPYGVEAVPADLAPNYTTGRYNGAPLGGDRGGYYWVNTFALDKRPLYNLPALTLHEGVPGHHHQSALGKEAVGVPEFRKRLYPHAFGEGWGLYSEKLGIEMGIYKTPYENFGRLTYEMWRACRLVIDTGIHAKGWTRKQAQDYLANNTALSLLNVRTEVDRYISWPGQALAYKMGELTILELRAQAEQALGDQFDIRTFHDAILAEGGVPLEVLRSQIQKYIEDNR